MGKGKWAMVFAGVCLVVAVLAIAYGASTRAAARVIRAKRFEVVDEEGMVRAGLGVLADKNTGLWVLDGEGKERATLAVSAEGSASLSLREKHGGERASL